MSILPFLDKLMRATYMKEIRLLIDIIVGLILIKEDRRVAMYRLVRSMLMNVCGEIACIMAIRDRNLYMPSMNLL